MKTPVTEIERRELEQKLEAAGQPLDNPLPEFFFGAQQGKLLVNYAPDGFKMGIPPGYMKMFVAAQGAPGMMHHVLKVFCLN